MRFWGIGLLAMSVIYVFIKEIPVGFEGRTPSFYLKGWKKSFAIVPVALLGLSVSIFPHEIACYLELRGYNCT